jgi:archaellum biogenesis ATPase FlaH
VVSTLIIVNVERMQDETNKIVKLNCALPIVYVSLNKTHANLKKIFTEKGLDMSNIFFVDCVTNEQKSEDVMHVKPTELDRLEFIINSFIKEIAGKKLLIIDALSTLLIYNNENKVAQFVKSVSEYASEKDVEVVALSPKTEGEELLRKIFNFFNKVEKK